MRNRTLGPPLENHPEPPPSSRRWEGLRTDSLMIGPIRVSQLLAGVSFLAATAIMVWIHFKKHPDGSDMLVNRQKPAAEPEKS